MKPVESVESAEPALATSPEKPVESVEAAAPVAATTPEKTASYAAP